MEVLVILLVIVAQIGHACQRPSTLAVERRALNDATRPPVLRFRGGESALITLKKRMQAAGPAGLVGVLPKACDALLAGVGLAGSLAIMGALEPKLGVKLVVPPMMASGIIFFSGSSPPNPKGFLTGTLGCATLSSAMLRTLSGRVSAAAAQGCAAGSLLMWYKFTGAMFPPAAVLCVLMGQAASSTNSALSFVMFPWLAGHVALYVSALGISSLRSQLQFLLSHSRLQALGTIPDEELRKIFVRFDTSRDGFIDATELRLALRVALSTDVSLADCQRLVASTDKNGDGVVDYKEFKAITRGKLSAKSS